MRSACQLVCLLVFFFLFFNTDYSGSDTLDYAVNILFRLDPLLALSTMLAVRTIIALMLPALIVIVFTLLFGRAFCGWVCPLGSLIDVLRPLVKTRKPARPTLFPSTATVILVFVLAAAMLGVPMAGYADPFSILVRGLAQAFYPAAHHLTVSLFTVTYQHAPAAVNHVTEPLYAILQRTVLPYEQKFYDLAVLSLLMLLLVFVAELVQRRFFCRNICPLGALFSWVARFGLLSLQGGDDGCGKCRHCISICRMGAIDEQRGISVAECSLCMDCLEQCPRQVISFRYLTGGAGRRGFSLSRRRLIGAVSAGLLIAPVLGVRRAKARSIPELIRPPGARLETEFLQRCVRCAECIQVCIGNALQPVWLEAGIEGIFSPRLVARTGYCEFNCTLCGQVCPTGAIRELTLAEKHACKIGNAWFDRNRCLPYAKAIPCIVCEEHCPTPDKAIKFNEVELIDERGDLLTLRQPYVVDELCIGCGICETRCPLPGHSAIIVTSEGEVRNPDNRLPERSFSSPGGYGAAG